MTHQSQNFSAHSAAEQLSSNARTWNVVAKSKMFRAWYWLPSASWIGLRSQPTVMLKVRGR